VLALIIPPVEKFNLNVRVAGATTVLGYKVFALWGGERKRGEDLEL
jgi:hypothetical protein